MAQESFNDYYEMLQVSPRADQETIERVYRLLAKRYHPDNSQTGDAERFNELTQAYRALSNPEKRAGYDAKYDEANTHQWNVFSQAAPSKGADEDQRIYQAILSMLYTARRRDAENPGVGIFQLEKLLGVPEKYLEFHVWYLKEKGWIQRVDNGGWAITAGGVDTAMENDLPVKRERLLPPAGETSPGSNDIKDRRKDLLDPAADSVPS